LSKAVEKCGEFHELIKRCKALAQRTHQSTLDWQDIQKACESVNVIPVKIIQPVVTRWNSNYMMLNSILKIKAGLLVAADTLDKPDLQALIPNERDFSIIKKILPFLEKCKSFSDKWSSEKKVTVHDLQLDILNLHLIAKRMVTPEESYLSDFVKTFMAEFEQRLPMQGMGIGYYNVGSLLHPYYRGYALKKISNSEEGREAAIKVMVDAHQSTKQFYQERETEKSSFEMSSMDDGMDDPLHMEYLKEKMQVGTSSADVKPPLQMEFEKFQAMALPEKDICPLQWWKAKEKELPMLADLARKHFCVPVTSASSERMFSVGGKIVSDYRHNISAEKTSMLVFINQNFGKVKSDIKKWVKTCAGEPYELPDSSMTQTPSQKQTQSQSQGSTQTQSQTDSQSLLEPPPGPSGLKRRRSEEKEKDKHPKKQKLSQVMKNKKEKASRDMFDTETEDEDVEDVD
jgi:hypothetical protein